MYWLLSTFNSLYSYNKYNENKEKKKISIIALKLNRNYLKFKPQAVNSDKSLNEFQYLKGLRQALKGLAVPLISIN